MDTPETTIYHAILIIAVTIGSIILYLIISLIRHHRSRLKLYQSKINAEITTLEKERTRMAADLHDELGPILSAAKFKLATIHVKEEERCMLSQVEDHIDTIIIRMREISKDLMPVTLIRKGPLFAIQEFLHSTLQSVQLDIQFYPCHVPDIPGAKGIHVYRIVQEIVHNTLKHARARHLKVYLHGTNNGLTLISEDDGNGFDLNQILREKTGRGLQNILSRTEILNGKMYLESMPGTGTRLMIEIPLPSPSKSDT